MRRFVVVVLLATLAGACSESAPSSQASDDPTVSPVPLSTVPVPASTLATVAPTAAPTAAPVTTVAVTTTAARVVEDLEDGDHVGYVVSVEGGVIGFDRVEPVDAEGDGVIESVTNANPRVRAVPMPDPVQLNGEVTDAATATAQLAGGQVLVRLTVQGQQLIAIELLTLGAPPAG